MSPRKIIVQAPGSDGTSAPLTAERSADRVARALALVALTAVAAGAARVCRDHARRRAVLAAMPRVMEGFAADKSEELRRMVEGA